MHYYKRNIGDYHKKAGRLSMLEHGAYTLLIDSCYDREQFPTLEEANDWAWARTDAELAAVKFVLSKFFTLEDGVYIQNRIKEELDDYKDKSETNSRIAQEREANRKKSKQDVNESSRTVNESCGKTHEPPPNHKPITINHKPLTINQSNTIGDFDVFWTQYPNKTAKQAAVKAWGKLKPNESLFNTIIDALEKQKPHFKVGFIPHPATWLNGRRWEDAIPAQAEGQETKPTNQPKTNQPTQEDPNSPTAKYDMSNEIVLEKMPVVSKEEKERQRAIIKKMLEGSE